MSGGNPVDGRGRAAARRGRPASRSARASSSISTASPRRRRRSQSDRSDGLAADLAAYLALVKGSMLAAEDRSGAGDARPGAAARPGTLVEEAALRRSVASPPRSAMRSASALSSESMSAPICARPMPASSPTPLSPASSPCTCDRQALVDIAALMEPEQEKVIFLRIARRAAIDGLDRTIGLRLGAGRKGRDGQRSAHRTLFQPVVGHLRHRQGGPASSQDRPQPAFRKGPPASRRGKRDRRRDDRRAGAACLPKSPRLPRPNRSRSRPRPRKNPMSPSCRRSKAQCRSSQPLHPVSRSQPAARRRQRTGRAGTERARDKGAGSTCSRRCQRCGCCRAGIGVRRRRRARPIPPTPPWPRRVASSI